MGVFFGLGDSKVSQSIMSHDVGQDHVVMLWFECDGECAIAVVRGYESEPDGELVAAFESGEIGLGESHGRFASAVGPEVEEDHAIMVADGRDRIAAGIDDCDWFHEFIGHALGIILLNSRNGIGSLPAFTKDEETISLLDAVPSLVAVHREIPAHNGCDLPETVFPG